MTFVTPVDGQPALASHVSQITNALTGVSAEPITLAGNLLISKATPRLELKRAADAYPRFRVQEDGLFFGLATSDPDTGFTYGAPGVLESWANLKPVVSNTYDLGTTSARWKKVWAIDAEFNSLPTISGSALSTYFLPLAGGTLSGDLLINKTSAPVIQSKRTIDSQYRMTLQESYLAFGSGAAAADTTLQRVGVGLLRIDTSLGLGVAPKTWDSFYNVIQLGQRGAIYGVTSGSGVTLNDNSYEAGGSKAIITAAATKLAISGGYLFFSNAPSATADAGLSFLTRLQIDPAGNMMLGTPAPKAWASGTKAFSFHAGAAIWGHDGNGALKLGSNSYYDASYVYRAVQTGQSARIEMDYTGNPFVVYTAPSVTQDTAQTFTARLLIGTTGRTTLTPDAGVDALVANGNVGIGVTPATASTSYRMIQMGQFNIQTQPGVTSADLNVNTRIGADVWDRAILTGAASKLSLGSNSLTYRTAPSVATDAQQTFTQRFVIDANGIVGVGVTPAAWHLTTYKVLQIGQAGVLHGDAANANMQMQTNCYNDASGVNRAIVAGGASVYASNAGAHIWYTAPSVGAGAALTFTERMRVDGVGRVFLYPDAGAAAIQIGTTPQPKITVAAGAPSSPMTGDLWIW